MIKLTNPYSKPILSTCYKYNQQGHQSSGWPLRKSVNTIKIDDEGTDEVICSLNGDDDDDHHHHQEEYTSVVRKLILSQKSGNNSQRHKLLCFRCTIQEKVFELIIDSGN